jgi:hypothetical protein
MYIRIMANMSKPMSDDAHRFIDEFAALQAPWGMPRTIGRIYGYLLLSEAPASLDDISDALDIAKSSVCVATQALERAGLTRRHGERGTKRVRYAASEGGAGLLAAKAALLGALGHMLQQKVPAELSRAVRARLDRQGDFYLKMRDAIEIRLREFEARHVDVAA